MSGSMTPYQQKKARDAGIPASLDAEINSLLLILDQHGVTLNWDGFLLLLAPDPPLVLRRCLDFAGTFEPWSGPFVPRPAPGPGSVSV